MTPERLAINVGIPGVICATALVVAWRPLIPRRPTPERALWGGAIGYGGALLFAMYSLFGVWPALERTESGWLPVSVKKAEWWLVYLVVLATVIGLGASFARKRRARQFWGVSIVLLALATTWLLLGVIIEREWATPVNITIGVAAITLDLIAFHIGFEYLGRQEEGWGFPLSLWLASAGASITLVISGNALFGELLAALAACAGASVVVGVLRRDFRINAGATPVITVMYLGLLMLGYFYGLRDSFIPFVILAVAPLAPWIGRLRVLRRRKNWQRVLIQLLSVGVLVGAAAVVAKLSIPPDPYGHAPPAEQIALQ